MKILINCSNLQVGGGIQVANSICCDLQRFTQHSFVVVLPNSLMKIEPILKQYHNVQIIHYNFARNIQVMLTGRDKVLDSLVQKYSIEAVLTVFGPSYWQPKCPHLCGFARPHIVLKDTIYFDTLPFLKRIKLKIFYSILTKAFCKGVTAFFTENSYITEKWKKIIGGHIDVYTVTNYYNQVYDSQDKWKTYSLPKFDGKTFLCISAYRPHKNLEISIQVAKILKQSDPNLKFRFVFTINDNYISVPDELKSNFVFTGPIDIRECPSLYTQADIMFQPTLLECFTATYPEAMRMEVPIVTTDMEFARGLCGDAAIYYSPLDPMDAAKALQLVIDDVSVRKKLINNGKQQLLKFDNYSERTNKLIKHLENFKKLC